KVTHRRLLSLTTGVPSSRHSLLGFRHWALIGHWGLVIGHYHHPRFRVRRLTDRPCAVSPSALASVSMAAASRTRLPGVYSITLVRRRKLRTETPLQNRAVPPVGSTCDGPAT